MVVEVVMDDNYTGMNLDRHRTLTLDCIDKLKELCVRVVQAKLEGIRLVFDDLWENVEYDVKKWTAGKSTTEKRLENLKERISETELEIQKILMERIEDKQNSDMYDKMIETRRNDTEKFKKEVYEIKNLDLRLKSPFVSKAKESLLKKYFIVNNEIMQEGA